MRLPDGSVRKRRRSLNVPGHAHALTFSCYRRLPLLSKDRTRLWFIEALAKARETHTLALWAYVIMPEHAHVLLCPRSPDHDLSEVLRSIKQPVARRAGLYLRATSSRWLDRLTVIDSAGGSSFRFWQRGGGYDRNLTSLAVVRSTIDYIHHNPVRRGLAERPTHWKWSSARFYAGDPSAPLAMDAIRA